MNIWIDITNSPHVNFFAQMIRQLSDEGHNLVLTCRPLANTIELLDLHEFDYETVGRHYGRNRAKKALGFAARCGSLYRALKSRRIDAAISHSSFYSPLVAKMLGVPCIYLNDNEHASGNKIAFRFAQQIMVPEFLSTEAVMAQGAKKDKIIHYPGVKEGIYLWSLSMPASSTQTPGTQTPGQQTTNHRTIIVRPEPWAAEYYKGSRDFLDDLLIGLSEMGHVILLPRGEVQAQHYRQSRFSQIHIPDTPLSLPEFVEKCDLFIGAGGTMTREAAVLGIPTISIYQDQLLAVDEYLVDCGAMVHNPHANAEFVANYLATVTKGEPDSALLVKGREAYELIKTNLTNTV